jgi:hypothetical protein
MKPILYVIGNSLTHRPYVYRCPDSILDSDVLTGCDFTGSWDEVMSHIAENHLGE